MILKSNYVNKYSKSLKSIIDDLDCYSYDTSFGVDIDEAQEKMFINVNDEDFNCRVFLEWVSRYQPCLFGRLGAKEVGGVSYDICWVTSEDINAGDFYIINKIQMARRKWKDRALEGIVSGFLIMFQHPNLARAKPGSKLLSVCKRASELYLIENSPLQYDTIYTEAIPLIFNGKYGVFKGGVNIFYPGAHRTLNHDRRIPGGLLISVNSPGHLANALVKRGYASSFNDAVQQVYNLAMLSVGNGGIGYNYIKSTSWHNVTNDLEELNSRPLLKHCPHYIPENYSGRTYSATYHTDVLLPTEVTVSSELDPDYSIYEIWSWLVIDYISEIEVPSDHINYGLFHPHSILPEAIYHNPWPPRLAKNSPLFDY